MSRTGKITIFVQQSRHQQSISIRTVGQRGPLPLNTITVDTPEGAQSPSTTAVAFWTDVLTKAIAAL